MKSEHTMKQEHMDNDDNFLSEVSFKSKELNIADISKLSATSSHKKSKKNRIVSPHFSAHSSILGDTTEKKVAQSQIHKVTKMSNSKNNSNNSSMDLKNSFSKKISKSPLKHYEEQPVHEQNYLKANDSLMDLNSLVKVKKEIVHHDDMTSVQNNNTQDKEDKSFDISFSNMIQSPQFSKKVPISTNSFVSANNSFQHDSADADDSHKIDDSSYDKENGSFVQDSSVQDSSVQENSKYSSRLQKLQNFYIPKDSLFQIDVSKKSLGSKDSIDIEKPNSVSFSNTQQSFTDTFSRSVVKSTPKDIKKNVSFNKNIEAPVSNSKILNNSSVVEYPSINSITEIKDPGKYVPIDIFLHDILENEKKNTCSSSSLDKYTDGVTSLDSEFKDDLFEQIFQHISGEEDRKMCFKFSNSSMREWVDYGLKFNKRQSELIEKLMKARMDLSYKFKVITDLINDRAESLNKTGELIDEKLVKVKKLSNEILDII